MPPKGKSPRPTRPQIAKVRRWIQQGAAWPKGLTLDRYDVSTDRWAGRDWWSLQPIRHPVPPAFGDTTLARNPIDRFILARLAEQVLCVERRPPLERIAGLDPADLPAGPPPEGR